MMVIKVLAGRPDKGLEGEALSAVLKDIEKNRLKGIT
jgi:hypothetical protein